jgi:integrase
VKKGLKSKTKANYQYMYDKFVRNSRIGTMPLQKLTKYDLVAFYTGLVDKQMLSVSACVTLQNVIGPAIEIAIDSGILIRRNVSLGALKELKKQEQIKKADDRATNGHKMQSLTLAEQKRFLEVIKDKWYEPVFTIALLTGMRCGELCGLTEDCIDYKNNVIHVRQNLVYFKKADGHCGLEVHAVKTVAGNRDLPLNDKIKEMLDKQKKFMDPKWADFEVDGVKGFLFTGPNGNSIFLPFCGFIYKEELSADFQGYLWTSTRDSGWQGQNLKFNRKCAFHEISPREFGLNIRPIIK